MSLIIKQLLYYSKRDKTEYLNFCRQKLSWYLLDNGLISAWAVLNIEMMGFSVNLPSNHIDLYNKLTLNANTLYIKILELKVPRQIRDDLRLLGLYLYLINSSNNNTTLRLEDDFAYTLNREALDIFSFFSRRHRQLKMRIPIVLWWTPRLPKTDRICCRNAFYDGKA